MYRLPRPGAFGEALSGSSYTTIVADPPWPQAYAGVNFGRDDHRGKAKGGSRPRRDYAMPYSTMTCAEIRSLPVPALAARDSLLYLWTTNQFLRESYAVAEAWGFTVSTTLVWQKPSTGFMGGTFLNNVEFIQFCRRGNGRPALSKIRTRVFEWGRDTGAPRARGRGHSAKPEAFYELVESVSPGPYLDLFARRERDGWAVWGDEVDSDVELSA